jgi:hypothetical protein
MIGVVERVRWWAVDRVNRAGWVLQRAGLFAAAVVVEAYSAADNESFPAALKV